MKKLLKSLSLILVIALVFMLTGCAEVEKIEYTSESSSTVEILREDPTLKIEGKTIIGFLTVDEVETENLPAGTYHMFYKAGEVPAGHYSILYVSESEYATGNYSYPEPELEEGNFAGWYSNAKRIATSNQAETDVLYARYISFGQAGLIVVVCVLIVFAMLALLWGIVSLFKFIAPKKKQQNQEVKQSVSQVEAPKQAIKLVDIKDEDMMVAGLVATVDYHEETKKDVRIVSIKEIK